MRCSAFGGQPYQWPWAPVMSRATKASRRPAASGSFMDGYCSGAVIGAGSVPEVANAGQHHRDAALVGGGDDFVVAHAAAGLDHAGGAGIADDVEPIAKREEGVARDGRSLQREAGVLGLDARDARR